jgi:hypothetical protein
MRGFDPRDDAENGSDRATNTGKLLNVYFKESRRTP